MGNEILRKNLEALKDSFIKPTIKTVYDDIAVKAANEPLQTLANQITILESQNAVEALGKIEDKVRDTLKASLKQLDVNDNDCILIENKVMNRVNTPVLQLCNKKDFDFEIGMGIPSTEKETTAQTLKKSKGKYIFAAGAALEVIAWLFIPSLSIWSPIVHGIGLILTVAGAVYTINEIRNAKRKNVSKEELAPAMDQKKQINELVVHQYELNCNIINNWLDEIVNAAIDEYEKEIKM